MTTPAERRAEKNGLATVLMIPWELIHVAQGHPTITRTLQGVEVLVRIPTTDELLKATKEAGERLIEQGQHPGPGMTADVAYGLTRPLPE